jgi:hypothetical protein
MRRFSKTARKELETIKDIRNEFGHRDARSFSFERIRDLANNLFFECARGISPRCVQARSGEPGKWGVVRSLQPIRKRPPDCLPLHQANSLRENAIFVRVSSSGEHFYWSATRGRARRFIIFET